MIAPEGAAVGKAVIRKIGVPAVLGAFDCSPVLGANVGTEVAAVGTVGDAVIVALANVGLDVVGVAVASVAVVGVAVAMLALVGLLVDGELETVGLAVGTSYSGEPVGGQLDPGSAWKQGVGWGVVVSTVGTAVATVATGAEVVWVIVGTVGDGVTNIVGATVGTYKHAAGTAGTCG